MPSEPSARRPLHAFHAPGPFRSDVRDGVRGIDVSLRTTGPEPRGVWVRSEPDNEERLDPLRRTDLPDGSALWRGRLPLVTHRPDTRYAFRVLLDGAQRWWSQAGWSPYPPPVELHFRHVEGYRAPQWLWRQVAYQVFPDRFRNGDPANDVRSGAYAYGGRPVVARGWDELPDPRQGAREFFGGDLAGVRDALPYLADLGATLLYLNPVFTSPSSHKYDTVDYRHVDPHLGGDDALLALLEAARARGMRVLLDAVVNHTSERHPWFDRYGEHGDDGAYQRPQGPHGERYTFRDADDPESYEGWYGTRTLPVLDFASAAVRRDLVDGDDAVLRHWLRPPWSIDGWRLDVVHMLGDGPGALRNHDHVRAMRRAIREEHADAYVLGEHFFEASAWLQGDQEDGAMNYYGFQRPMLAFWAGVDHRGDPCSLDAAGLSAWLDDARARIPFELALSQLNLLGSHDVPRFLTRVGGDAGAMRAAQHALFGYVGVPCVYYGDEVGLEGGGDPDCRRPFPWDAGRWDHALRATVRRLAHLRRVAPPLAHGAYLPLLADGDVFAFARASAEGSVVVLQHRGSAPRRVALPVWRTFHEGSWTDAITGVEHRGASIELELPPRSGATLVSDAGWLDALPAAVDGTT